MKRTCVFLSLVLLLAGTVLRATPANDDFEAAVALAGAPLDFSGTTTGASAQPDEPQDQEGLPAENSVWWTWTAAVPGPHLIAVSRLDDLQRPTFLDVFSGDRLETLSRLALVTNSSAITLLAEAGATYRLRLSGPPGIKVSGQVLPPPTNDAFADRVRWTGTRAETRTFTRGTFDPGEQPLWPEHLDSSLWWSWTAPADGVAELRLDGNWEGRLGVFTGESVGTLVAVTDVWAEGRSLRWSCSAGRAYQLGIASYNDEIPFLLELQWSPPWPDNDDVAAAVRLEGVRAVYEGTTFGAANAPGERLATPLIGSPAGQTTWHVWRAPVTGSAQIEVEGFFGWAVLQVFSDAGFTLLPSSDLRQTRFTVTAGRDYFIQVDSVLYRTGEQPEGVAYELRVKATTLRLMIPAEGSEFAFGEPIPLAISTPDPAVDGEVVSVRYLGPNGHFLGFGPAYTNLAPAPPFVGVWQVAAVFETADGSRFHLPPVGFVVRPANDSFADAEEITDVVAGTLARLSAATMEPGEAAGVPGGGSVWYQWIAPGDGWLRLRLPGAPSEVQVLIYEGTALDRLTLRRTYQPNGQFEILDFEVREGTPYFLALRGPAGAQDSPFAMMFAAQAGPLLTLPKRRSDGGLEAWLTARPDTEYVIERSADLVHWQEVLRDRLGPWARPLELPAVGASSQVFYRSRRAP